MALRKTLALLEYGARVTVISPRICEGIKDLLEKSRISVLLREMDAFDIEHAALVVAATDDREVNRKVSWVCAENKTLVNVVDDIEESDFIFPSTVKRGDFTIAVSTSGHFPTLARKVREELEESYGEQYGSLVAVLGTIRQKAVQEIQDASLRNKIFEKLAECGWSGEARNMSSRELERYLSAIYEVWKNEHNKDRK